MKLPLWHMAVLIPASNEEDLLARCLDSVKQASLAVLPQASLDIILVADRSTDRTREIGERLLRGFGDVVETDAGVVGNARARAAQKALGRYGGARELCWLCNTDADSFVPPTWLRDQLVLARQGIHAVAGTICVDSFDEHLPLVRDRFRETYLIAPDGSHTHVHGANLGVRADFYLRAGGWRALSTAEDHDLWDRLETAGARRITVSHIEVVTSGRRVGRAPNGFAAALAAHNAVPA